MKEPVMYCDDKIEMYSDQRICFCSDCNMNEGFDTSFLKEGEVVECDCSKWVVENSNFKWLRWKV